MSRETKPRHRRNVDPYRIVSRLEGADTIDAALQQLDAVLPFTCRSRVSRGAASAGDSPGRRLAYLRISPDASIDSWQGRTRA
jgi:hypothetical protein